GPRISDDPQHPAYLRKAESKTAAVGDETYPLEIIGREVSVGTAALEYAEEPDRLVVAEWFFRNSGPAGRFSNSHVGSSRASELETIEARCRRAARVLVFRPRLVERADLTDAAVADTGAPVQTAVCRGLTARVGAGPNELVRAHGVAELV